jgi:hypothetical protein
MEPYSHTQAGYVWLVILSIVEALAVVTILVSGAPVIGIVIVFAVTSLLIVVGLTFSRLTVEVHPEGVTARFGQGWPKRFVPFSAITSARTVRNSPWVGWGLRWIPGGSVWNVWGLDSVELTLVTGKRWRLGTDEPDALLAALAGSVPTT